MALNLDLFSKIIAILLIAIAIPSVAFGHGTGNKQHDLRIASFTSYPVQTYTTEGKRETSLSKKQIFAGDEAPKVVGIYKRMQFMLLETGNDKQYFVHKRIIVPVNKDDWNSFIRSSGGKFYCVANEDDENVKVVMGKNPHSTTGATKGLASKLC